VLESIYEPIFLKCSFGFRAGKSCHDAIYALHKYLYNNEIQTIIDIDLKNFFGTIDHKLLEDILKQKIKDIKFMRYINRMFKAGILTERELKISEEGVPQGGLCKALHKGVYVARYSLISMLITL
jgi:RNA-directed DNA polymerase